MAAKGKYTFGVKMEATKPLIKQEVEKRFGVNVVGIKTMIIPGKSYRSGKKWIYRYKADQKKAVVQLKKDQKIGLFEVTK